MEKTPLDIEPREESVVATLSASALGSPIRRIWNPSPSVKHRTEPYDVPQTLRIGVAGSVETGARFSPPPFAVIVEHDNGKAFVGVGADHGWHRWNEAVFRAEADRLTVSIDLEGHTDPQDALQHVRFEVIPGEPGESLDTLLARGLRQQYPGASAAANLSRPDWWYRPIYCGWGDQATVSMYLEGVGPEPRALAYCTQGLYERWIRRLEQANVPFGTVIIDAGWSPAGVWVPDTVKWPDLKGFIARQHERGRRVLLWLATWLHQGLPASWCIHCNGTPLTADPTNPEYQAFLKAKVHHLISPDGYDADGFKIDQLAFCPSERHPIGGERFGATGEHNPPGKRMRPSADVWGCELLYLLQKQIYDAAKTAKPDALVTSSTVHPYFHDTLDMVRLHDMGHVATDIFAAMGARAALSRAALPGKPIDADDWIHTDYALWLRYTSHGRTIGVPCIFYAGRFMLNWSAEPATKMIPLRDLRRIAAAWRQ